jgi:IstB-like ATP binding protein
MSNELLLETYLKQLRLPCFLESYQALAQEAARTNLSYERYLLALAQEEVARQDASRIERAIANAHFPVLKELADFDFSVVPDVPKPRILDLAQGGYISRAEPIILIGNPGLGKTHVASGLAVAACRQGRKVRFYNVAGLAACRRERSRGLARRSSSACPSQQRWGDSTKHEHRQNIVSDDAPFGLKACRRSRVTPRLRYGSA